MAEQPPLASVEATSASPSEAWKSFIVTFKSTSKRSLEKFYTNFQKIRESLETSYQGHMDFEKNTYRYKRKFQMWVHFLQKTL